MKMKKKELEKQWRHVEGAAIGWVKPLSNRVVF